MMYSYAEKIGFFGSCELQNLSKIFLAIFLMSFKCNPYDELHNILQGE
jgi:hypothetical protein